MVVLLQGSTSVLDVQDFFRKSSLPLVGHRKQSNDAKRYSKRPLVVVYYGVDFSFDYRKGRCSTSCVGQHELLVGDFVNFLMCLFSVVWLGEGPNI